MAILWFALYVNLFIENLDQTLILFCQIEYNEGMLSIAEMIDRLRWIVFVSSHILVDFHNQYHKLMTL